MRKVGSYREGSLRRIAELFMKPILSRMPPDSDAKDWLTQMMGLHEREVVRYRVMKSFEMPGSWLEQPNIKRPPPQGPRAIPRGAMMWVRSDTRERFLHIEATGKGAITATFEIDSKHWASIRPLLYRVRQNEQ